MSSKPAQAHPIKAYLDALNRQYRSIAELVRRVEAESLSHIAATPWSPSVLKWTEWTAPTSYPGEFHDEAIRLFATALAATTQLPKPLRKSWRDWLMWLQANHLELLNTNDENDWSRIPIHLVSERAVVVEGMLVAWSELELVGRQSSFDG